MNKIRTGNLLLFATILSAQSVSDNHYGPWTQGEVKPKVKSNLKGSKPNKRRAKVKASRKANKKNKKR